jgi:hypothetical protein
MINTKKITLDLPLNYNIPDKIVKNDPDENALIITIGNRIRLEEERIIQTNYKDKEIQEIIQSNNKNNLILNNQILNLKNEITELKSQNNNYINNILELKQSNDIFYSKGKEEGKILSKNDYDTEISIYKNLIEEYKNKNEDLTDKICTLTQNNNDTIRKFLKEELKPIQELNDKFKNSSHKGKCGENFIENYIINNFITIHNNPSYKNVSGKDGYGDFEYIDNELKLLIEVKNIEETKARDIKKFQDNVVSRVKNHNFNAGLFICLNDNIIKDGKKDFLIEPLKVEINNSCVEIPLIYISDVISHPHYIKVAINYLYYFIKNKYTFTSNHDNNPLLIQSLDQFKHLNTFDLQNIYESNKKLIKSLDDTNKAIEQIILNSKNILTNVNSVVTQFNYNKDIAIQSTKLNKTENEIVIKATSDNITHVTTAKLKEYGYTDNQIKKIKLSSINNILAKKS